MGNTEPTTEQWRQVYDLATRIRDLAPWTWMWDTDLMAFRDPVDGCPRFVGVMGRNGEHFAVGVYPRVEDVFRVIDLALDPEPVPEMMVAVSNLQLSFEDRDYLDPSETRAMKRLGYRFRGKQAWPCLRSYLPSQFPWFVDSEELRQLILGLEMVLAVAPRFKGKQGDLDRLNSQAVENHTFLVHTRTEVDGKVQWEGEMMTFQRPAPPEIVQEMDKGLLKRVARLPIVQHTFEVDMRPTLAPIQEQEGKRPYFPWTMLVVESGDGLIAGYEMLAPFPTINAVYSRAAGVLLDVLAKQKARPVGILVRDEKMAALLGEVCGELGVELSVQSQLPALEQAFDALNEFAAER